MSEHTDRAGRATVWILLANAAVAAVGFVVGAVTKDPAYALAEVVVISTSLVGAMAQSELNRVRRELRKALAR